MHPDCRRLKSSSTPTPNDQLRDFSNSMASISRLASRSVAIAASVSCPKGNREGGNCLHCSHRQHHHHRQRHQSRNITILIIRCILVIVIIVVIIVIIIIRGSIFKGIGILMWQWWRYLWWRWWRFVQVCAGVVVVVVGW